MSPNPVKGAIFSEIMGLYLQKPHNTNHCPDCRLLAAKITEMALGLYPGSVVVINATEPEDRLKIITNTFDLALKYLGLLDIDNEIF